TFSLLYMRTSSPDRPAVQLSVRTPKSRFCPPNSPYFTATHKETWVAKETAPRSALIAGLFGF
ncbi:hypothetical protein, partial [Collinsella aerofaciens]